MKRARGSSILFVFLAVLLPAATLSAQSTTTGASEPRLTAENEAIRFAALPEPLSWRDLSDMALWASGAPADARAPWSAKLDEAVAALSVPSGIAALGEGERGDRLLSWLHGGLLRQYVERQTRLDTLLDTGRFNCVSASVIYLVLGTAIGLDIDGVATNDHAFCIVHLASGEAVDVETTNSYGYDPAKRREFLDSFGKVTGFAYVPQHDYRSRAEIAPRALVSLILANRISGLETAGRYGEAVGLAVDRWTLLGGGAGKAHDDLLACLQNYASSLGRTGREADCLDWSERAIAVFGDRDRWSDILSAAVNNLVARNLNAGRIDAARSILAERLAQIPERSRDRLAALIEEASLATLLNGAKSTDSFRAAVAAVNDKLKGGSPLPGTRLTETLVSLYHNEFARRYNSRDWAGARDIAIEGLSAIPGNSRLTNDREIAEKLLAK